MGSSSITGDETIGFFDNMSFDGTPRNGKLTADFQGWFGQTASPHVKKRTLRSPLGSITFAYSTALGVDYLDLEADPDQLGLTITGNTGTPASPSSGNWDVVTANSTVKFSSTTPTITQDFGISNLLLGTAATSITTAARNVGVGFHAGHALTSGIDNTFIGWSAGLAVTAAGNANVAIGSSAMASCTGGSGNTVIGYNALANYTESTNQGRNVVVGNACLAITNGIYNIALGYQAGINYSSSESSNIVIGNAGTTSESHVIRIGTSGSGDRQQNKCFIAGITGVTASSSHVVGVDSNGQLSDLNSIITINSGSQINLPSQPAFLAYLTTTVTDVSGDGTQYTVIYDTEVYDQGSNFNLGTSTFTAPVTGKYLICVSGSLAGGTVMSAILCRIVTSNRTYRITLPLNAGVTTAASAIGSVLADMDASDTFTITLQSTDTGGKIDDAVGTTGGEVRNWVSCELIA